jgi:hypothetical protein
MKGSPRPRAKSSWQSGHIALPAIRSHWQPVARQRVHGVGGVTAFQAIFRIPAIDSASRLSLAYRWGSFLFRLSKASGVIVFRNHEGIEIGWGEGSGASKGDNPLRIRKALT